MKRLLPYLIIISIASGSFAQQKSIIGFTKESADTDAANKILMMR